MTLQRVPINNFRGGLNTRDGPFDLQPNESPDLLNVTISSLVGQLETRKGKTRFDTAGAPGETADFMKQVVLSNGIRFLMLSCGGSVYACKPNGEVIKLFAGTAGTIWDFEQFADAAFKDWVYMSNGVDTPQKWDGIAAATVVWPVTKGALPNGGVLSVWENRMFISYVTANVQRIYFSEFGDPEATIEEYGFVDVRGPEDDLDAVQDLAVLGSRLFVMKRRSVFMITSSVTMQNRRVGGPGAWARFQTVEMEDKLYFFNPQGIWSTGGVQISMESGSINNYFPQKLNRAEAHKARLIATKDTYPRLLLALPTEGSTFNDKLIELIPHINFRRIGGRRYLLLPAFMLHSLSATSLATFNPTGAEEMIIGASTREPTGLTAPVVDSFVRANEKPISNGGKWAPGLFVSAHDQVLENHRALDGATGLENHTVWVAVQANPQASIEIVVPPKLPPLAHPVTLVVCYKEGPLLFEGGYQVSWYPQGNVQLYMQKANNPFFLKLGETIFLYQAGDQIGLSVKNGKVIAWLKREGEWKKILEATDSTWTTGKAHISCSDSIARLNNFALGEMPAQVATLYRLFNGSTDDGQPINAQYQTSWMTIQGEEPKERMRRLNVELSGDATVDVFVDFEEAPRFSSVLPLAAGGEGTQYRFVRVRPETRGRFHSVRFKSNLAGQPFFINGAEAVVRGGKEH